MDFEFSAEQEQLRRSVRRFLADRAPPAAVRAWYGDERGVPDDVWRGLVDLGVVGLLGPEAHGGAGRGMVDAAVVLEELGRAVCPSPYLATAVGAVSLVDGLDGWAAHPVLPGLAAGERRGAVAVYEPDRRVRWQDPATTARRDGDAWQLRGVKAHVDGGPTAEVLLVVAGTGPDELGVFAVEPGDATVTRHPDGRRDPRRSRP